LDERKMKHLNKHATFKLSQHISCPYWKGNLSQS